MNSSSSAIELHSGQKVAKFCPLTELVSSSAYLPKITSCNISFSVLNKTLISAQSNSELQVVINPRLSKKDKDKLLQK